jgi:hypothetical protein
VPPIQYFRHQVDNITGTVHIWRSVTVGNSLHNNYVGHLLLLMLNPPPYTYFIHLPPALCTVSPGHLNRHLARIVLLAAPCYLARGDIWCETATYSLFPIKAGIEGPRNFQKKIYYLFTYLFIYLFIYLLTYITLLLHFLKMS